MTAASNTVTNDISPPATKPVNADHSDAVVGCLPNLTAPQSTAEKIDGGNSLSSENIVTRNKSLQLYLIVAGTVIGCVSLIISRELWANRLFIHEGLHTAVETLGALAAIIMAMFLILKRRENYGEKLFLLGMGFLSMGLIDVFHSVSPEGQGFVLLRSMASLIGSFWFALIWLPWCASERDAVWKKWTPWAVVVGAISLGIWVSVTTNSLPTIVQNGRFTSTAVIVNLIAGLFFLAAAIRLLIDFGRMDTREIYLFACIAMLFGLANLTFPSSALWDATWWFWHVLRLISYVLVLGFVIHEHQQAISGLRVTLAERKKAEEEVRKHRDRLEELVQERTAELRKANEGLQQEMTDRKQIEQALLESEMRLRAILDNTTAVVYVKDTEGRYILVNRQFENLFHVSANEIRGKSDYDLFPSETTEALLANDQKVLELKRAMEFEEIVPDHDAQHVYISVKFPLHNFDGTPYGVCGMLTDITERKHTEEREISERKKAQDWLHTLVATTQDAVISINRFGRIVLFNPAAERMFGYTEAELQGQKVNLLMDEPYASEHDEYIARFERTNDARAIGYLRTVTGRRKNGEAFPIEISITQIGNDEEVRYAAFLRDISEKKKLHDQLIENERLAAMGAAAAAVAHEIGNPLNGMSMTAELLERRLGEGLDRNIVSGVRTLKNEISRLSTVLHDFGSFSRRERYSFQPTHLVAVAKEIFTMEMQNYLNRGVQVDQSFPEDLAPVRADRNRLKQALLNLCKNAVEAMPNGGTLTLRARNSGENVVLEIRDTGAGIKSGVDIFAPFTTTKSNGTGLGLMIVRQIVLAHQGTIDYTSEAGKGTVFTLTLPAA